MKHNVFADALNEIDPHYIHEAAEKPKRRRTPWIAAIAAVLAVAVLISAFFHLPGNHTTGIEGNQVNFSDSHLKLLAAAPEYPQMAAYPTEYEDDAYSAWLQGQGALHDQPEGYADNLTGYFGSLISQVLTLSDTKNITCSPLSLYMALAMLAETTDGESRQQLLDLLRADNIETLRNQAQQIWKGHYNNDGLSTSILASSLWLDEDTPYSGETATQIADSYFASVFRTDLGSEAATQALRDWLNEQTGGLLQEQAGTVKLDPRSILALASTVFYQTQWQDEFSADENTQSIFHSTAGDTEITFMNRQIHDNVYYRGDNFGAINLPLKDNSCMWLILPDEGYSPGQITEAVTAFFAADPNNWETPWEDQQSAIVNLSLPKFDISSDLELSELIRAMGVTDIFDSSVADFSPLFPETDGASISQVKHATRVAVDEKGVTAAAFTLILLLGGTPAPTEEIDFVLDRPFLFYIESEDGLPMFTGIVNQP